ncbi:hypothetical protein A3D78_04070 [Candidatus Gottesmanbacteria bacterium RIFCSPHIGHO2_02_FULL_39_14]|uniref:Uncharacterized protein n=1 Tax=Candidatus Gottesmanbacteria bacterium RIFCSPHIGHO2_02_FULL_39_14 TaxID=1798383 RepID=A0A1F5ZY41_9BACT|nr:MAG: hypothetical protein A3D78_04070 [Candidatus Gottesmanbacteria bacterium RIFCSPHIGHO2_02_FULL_39_14]
MKELIIILLSYSIFGKANHGPDRKHLEGDRLKFEGTVPKGDCPQYEMKKSMNTLIIRIH